LGEIIAFSLGPQTMPDDHPLDFDTRVKIAVYGAIAQSGSTSSIEAVAAKMGATPAAIKDSYARLRANRLLLLEADGVTIRVAPPFSGVPTQHRVTVDGMEYYVNCAWGALGNAAREHHRPTSRAGEAALGTKRAQTLC
jgi:hypothetical protein